MSYKRSDIIETQDGRLIYENQWYLTEKKEEKCLDEKVRVLTQEEKKALSSMHALYAAGDALMNVFRNVYDRISSSDISDEVCLEHSMSNP